MKPTLATVELMKTTELPGCRCGSAARVIRSGAATFVRHWASRQSRVVSSIGRGSKRLAVWTIPCRLPKAASASSTTPTA